jgi:tRNA A-37 threonylcarbamoyl transferase component Bud32
LKKLKLQDYLALREGAEVLERDPHGDKVLRLTDGTILKLFRRKRLLSSATLRPYARRFVANAGALARIGVPVPEVIGIHRVAELARDLVHYRPLPGATLRELARQGLAPERRARLRDSLSALIVRLHDAGIYFRSLHIGNVIVMPDDQLGLIDFSDLRVHPWPLGRYLRARNLRRMQGIADERDWLDLDAVLGGRTPAADGS